MEESICHVLVAAQTTAAVTLETTKAWRMAATRTAAAPPVQPGSRVTAGLSGAGRPHAPGPQHTHNSSTDGVTATAAAGQLLQQQRQLQPRLCQSCMPELVAVLQMRMMTVSWVMNHQQMIRLILTVP